MPTQHYSDNPRYGEDMNPRVYSSPLTSNIARNDVFSPLVNPMGDVHGPPSLNGTLYRDRNYFAQNGSLMNGPSYLLNRANNLKNFDVLSGQVHLDYSHKNDPLTRGLQPQDSSLNLLRQSRSDMKNMKQDNSLASLNGLNKLKKPNFNETFNPGPAGIMGTYNNYNVNRIEVNRSDDVRQSLKLPGKNIMVIDETQNRGMLPTINVRDPNNNNVPQKSGLLLKGATSQTNLNRNVTIIDNVEAGSYFNNAVNNNLEMSFKSGEGARALEKVRSIPALEPKNKFPKEVFSLNMKKKFIA